MLEIYEGLRNLLLEERGRVYFSILTFLLFFMQHCLEKQVEINHTGNHYRNHYISAPSSTYGNHSGTH